MPRNGSCCAGVVTEHPTLFLASETVTLDGPIRHSVERPAASGPRPGLVIAGKFRLCYELCTGGMASIWVARNQVLDVPVAIKLLRNVEAPRVADRLEAEARVSARLNHPNIISVYDLGSTEWNEPYIVMELLEGEDLRELLQRRGKLPCDEAVRLLLPILRGLSHAHRAGVVHRDLKPENIFLARREDRTEPWPKLLDFGIARIVEPRRESERRITVAGSVLGTLDYLPPEQAQGDPDVDCRADVWSFCALLFECVTGKPPFETECTPAFFRDLMETDAPTAASRGCTDQKLSDIIARGLQRDRNARWTSANDLHEALGKWLEDRSRADRPRSFAWRPALVAAAAIAALSSVAAVAYARLPQASRMAHMVRIQFDHPPKSAPAPRTSRDEPKAPPPRQPRGRSPWQYDPVLGF